MTRKEIKKQMTSAFVNNNYIRAAYGLQPGKTFEEEFSLVSVENIIFEIVSIVVFQMYLLFARGQKEIDDKILNQKTGRLAWYRTLALQYQEGFDLLPNADGFDNSGATAEQIEASKIVKYASVTESESPGEIIIKVATENNGVQEPITDLTGLTYYFEERKFAGTRINIISYLPDILSLELVIYRNPLVLDANGTSILHGNKPVEEAIEQFLKELPFNGELVLAHLIDRLQLVEGVEIPHLVLAQSKRIDPNSGGYGNWEPINVKKIPVSGWFKIDNFNAISYVV